MTRVNLGFLILCVLLGLAGGFGYASAQPWTYTATSQAMVVVPGTDAFSQNSISGQKASVYAVLAGSQNVANRVAKTLKIPSMEGTLTGSADAVPGLFTLTATASTPERARDIANAGIKAVSDEANAITTLNAPTAQPTTKTTTNPDGTQVTTTTQSVDGTTNVTTTDNSYRETRVTQTLQAVAPSAPSSPDFYKLSGMGALAGLVIGYLVVFMRRLMDNRVRHNSDVEELLGSSVLAVVPKSTELNAKGRQNVDGLGQAAEALRHLRTNLRFVDVDNPPRAIVMTSANPGEGKSTMSAVLAQMLASSGQRTVLIDTDLRKPVVHKIFGLDGSVGLTQILAGDMQLSDVAQKIEGQPNLRVVPAGRIPPNPSELLGSQRMKALMDYLKDDAMVIMDAPPLLPVTDAGLLSALADGAILVMEVGGTYKEQARLCGKIFKQVDGRLLGVVLNRASRRNLGSVYYGYGYGGYGQNYYYYEEDEKRKLLGFIPLPGHRKRKRENQIVSIQEEEVHPLPKDKQSNRRSSRRATRTEAPAQVPAQLPAATITSSPVSSRTSAASPRVSTVVNPEPVSVPSVQDSGDDTATTEAVASPVGTGMPVPPPAASISQPVGEETAVQTSAAFGAPQASVPTRRSLRERRNG